MKSTNLSTLRNCVMILCLFWGCTQEQDSKSAQNTARISVSSKKYIAVYERDTALLSFTRKGSIIEGKLRFSYANGNIEDGTIKGMVKGDTLLADYNFKSHNGRWYRNPVAFLQTGNKLKLGVGQFEITWGRTHFSKSVPIDYDKGRFVFVEIGENGKGK
jgi:hypothetical protein